jgi:hypothetical protein
VKDGIFHSTRQSPNENIFIIARMKHSLFQNSPHPTFARPKPASASFRKRPFMPRGVRSLIRFVRFTKGESFSPKNPAILG